MSNRHCPKYVSILTIITPTKMYLMKYGYMDNHHATHGDGRSAQLLSPDGLRNYIMDFQGFAGLNQTGVLDDETVKMMEMPRSNIVLCPLDSQIDDHIQVLCDVGAASKTASGAAPAAGRAGGGRGTPSRAAGGGSRS